MFSKGKVLPEKKGISRKIFRYLTEPQPYWTLEKFGEKWAYIDLYIAGVLMIGVVLAGFTIAYFLLAVDRYIGASVIVLITVVAAALEVKGQIYLNREIKKNRETPEKFGEKWTYADTCLAGVLMISPVLIGLPIAYFLLAADHYIGASVIVLITVVAVALVAKELISLNREIKNRKV